MISSTRDDLQEYRDHASKIIKRIADEKSGSIHIDDISMEKENQSGERESAVAVSKRWVTKSDWIILIVGFHYGSVNDDPISEFLRVYR
jgi:predicted Zn-dependent protease with MMP-like domain